MDQYLNSLYPKDYAIEKIAQNSALYKLANQEGLDISGLTPDQLEALAQEQLAALNEEQPQEETAIKEAQAQLEVADYMGRIMAHAYHQEMGLIEKAASAGMLGAGEAAIGKAKGPVGRYAAKAMDFVSKHKGATAGVLGGAAALGAGASMMGGKKEEEKTASAFDQLVRQHAMQIIQQQGADPSQLQGLIQQHEQEDQQLAQQEQYQQQPQYQAQQGRPQQSASAQMMNQGQAQQGYAGQGGQQRQQPQQRQVGFQPQQQQAQQQPQGQLEQQAQAEVIKQANGMVQGQFNELLETATWQMLQDAGYQIDDGQQQQQMGQPQMPQAQPMQ